MKRPLVLILVLAIAAWAQLCCCQIGLCQPSEIASSGQCHSCCELGDVSQATPDERDPAPCESCQTGKVTATAGMNAGFDLVPMTFAPSHAVLPAAHLARPVAIGCNDRASTGPPPPTLLRLHCALIV